MVCTQLSLWKVKTYIHCPQPGQSRDMDLCCGNPNKYPGQYCCSGLKNGLYSVGEIIGIIIGVFAAVILLAYVVLKCCGGKPTPPEPGNHLVVAPTAGTTSANPPDVPLLEYSILPPSGPLNQPHIEYSKTSPTDTDQDQPPPYPGPPNEN